MEHKIATELAKLIVPIADLKQRKGNPRRGNEAVIKESLTTNGQYRPIVVNSRNSEILAGNHTYRAAKALGWKSIAATFVDADPKLARRIVLVDNRTNDVADYDVAELIKELEAASGEDGLEGTGFDSEDLTTLLDELGAADEASANSDDPWDPGDPVIHYDVIFDNQEQQKLWYSFVKWLSSNYEGDTLAERLASYIESLELNV